MSETFEHEYMPMTPKVRKEDREDPQGPVDFCVYCVNPRHLLALLNTPVCSARLDAACADALATLANERGEGEPPCAGWKLDASTDYTCWVHEEAGLSCCRDTFTHSPAKTWGVWRKAGKFRFSVKLVERPTAREAMLAVEGIR